MTAPCTPLISDRKESNLHLREIFIRFILIGQENHPLQGAALPLSYDHTKGMAGLEPAPSFLKITIIIRLIYELVIDIRLLPTELHSHDWMAPPALHHPFNRYITCREFLASRLYESHPDHTVIKQWITTLYKNLSLRFFLLSSPLLRSLLNDNQTFADH